MTQLRSKALPPAPIDSALIVKADRLSGEAVEHAWRQIVPDSQVTTCHTGAAALSAMRANNFKIGIFGLTLPDIDGLDLLSTVVEQRLVRRIVVVTNRCDERTQQLLGRHSIDGYFNTSVECPKELPHFLDRIVAGCRHGPIGPRDVRADTRPTRVTELLTPGELKIFATIGDGSDDQAAAERLRLSPLTVHTHRKRIMRKLDVRTRPALMRIAIESGMVRITAGKIFRPGFEQPPLSGHDQSDLTKEAVEA